MSETDLKLNRLCKWRSILAGWQLGTRAKGDPESDAVRDHREVTLLLRAEVNALLGLMIEKGVFTHEEFDAAIGKEADLMNRDMEERFPGARADQDGMHIDPVKAATWLAGWKP